MATACKLREPINDALAGDVSCISKVVEALRATLPVIAKGPGRMLWDAPQAEKEHRESLD